MKKLKKIFLIIFLIFILFLLVDKKVFASTNLFQKVEYSEEYQKWLELTDEEKKNVIQPECMMFYLKQILQKVYFIK